MKMQNDRLYKKAYNDHKAKITIPVDMVSINAAKEGQALASDVDYRQYLHQWSCFPDQNDVIQARKAYELQSDVSRCCGAWGSGGVAIPQEDSLPQLCPVTPSNVQECFPCLSTCLGYLTKFVHHKPYFWAYSESFHLHC